MNMCPRILIVEDDSIVALDLKNIFEGLRYEVVGVANAAEEAIVAVTEKRPNLVLMDVVLKGNRDGISLAGEMKDRFELPVIYLTAHSNIETMERAKATGPSGYILKPFFEEELRLVVEIAFYKYRMERPRKEKRTNIKVLKGSVPLCAYCKKTRDEKGEWHQLEACLREYSGTDFTQCCCPECE